MTIETFSLADLRAEEIEPMRRRSVARVEHSCDPVKVRAEPLGEVWWQGREWAVTDYGLEKRDGTYPIKACDFNTHDNFSWSWPEHVAEKGWADVEDFTTAWLVALTLHGRYGAKCRDVIAKLPPVGGEY